MNTEQKIDKVIEECSELVQALCKVKRFGWFSHNPNVSSYKNIVQTREEMEDVLESCERLQEDMRQLSFEYYKDEK